MALKNTGATQGAASVKINLDPDEADIKTLDDFANQLVDTLKNQN